MKTLRCLLAIVAAIFAVTPRAAEPTLEGELIFPPEHWHVHASCIVEAPNGDLLVCWFQGSGERKSDDVKIEAARLRKGQKTWTKRFVMADTPEYPDTNCSLFVDPQGRLWLIWPTILANTWESALLKVWISDDWQKEDAPRWTSKEVLHITPPPTFGTAVSDWLTSLEQHPILQSVDEDGRRGRAWLAHMRSYSTNKLNQRLGWMTRAHPFILDAKRLIVPLYSDGFSFSLMAITDDWGKSWKTSAPLVGLGNIQPSIVQRKDGSLYTLMRDNGPPPKRLAQSSSRDRGETWEPVTDSEHPNPGSGAEIIGLKNGHWLLISNDTERGRNRLAVQISDDEGKTWKWKRYVENSEHTYDQFHYPSVMQARDGSIHATYSHHLGGPNLPKDVDGDPAAKSIKHVRFTEAWITNAPKSSAAFPLQNDDVVAFIGGADMSAAQHTGHLESLLAAKFPTARFRNLAWEGDTVYRQPRDLNFPTLKDQLKSVGATVIIAQFGKMESLEGPNKLADFEAAFRKLLDDLSEITPRIVLVTPTLPSAYIEAIQQIATSRQLQFANIAAPSTSDAFQPSPQDHAKMATAIARELGLTVNPGGARDRRGTWENPIFEEIRQAVIAKNELWFNYSRPQNWAFLAGDRTEQPSSRDHRDRNVRWFPEEMKQYTSLIAQAETQIQSAAHAVR